MAEPNAELEKTKNFGVRMAVFSVCFTPCLFAILKYAALYQHLGLLNLDDKAWTGACIGGILSILYFAYPNNFFQRRSCNLVEHEVDAVHIILPTDKEPPA